MPTPTAAQIRRTRPTTALIALLAALALLGAGCGDDGEQSAQDAFCESGDTLRESLDALFGIDLIAVGTSGIRDAFDQVVADVDALQASASEAAADEIAALDTAIDDAQITLSELADSISASNTSALTSSVGEIQNAATAVYETLTDCP